MTATSRTAARAAKGTRPLVLTRSDAAGKHTIKLLRALRVSSLAPGRYRLRIAPVTADGKAASVVTLYLWVLAPTKKARAERAGPRHVLGVADAPAEPGSPGRRASDP